MKLSYNSYRKYITILFVLIFLHHFSYAKIDGPTKKALESITPEDARKHVTYLASDKMKGRNSPSEELTETGNYITEHFRSIGLQPVNDKYYQSFYLHKINLGPIEKNRLVLKSSEGEKTSFIVGKDFIPFSETGIVNAEADLVFAGYGLRDSARKFDDYAELDVKNKIVVIVSGEPQLDTTKRPVGFRRFSGAARFSTKIQNAIELGAVGLLVINDIHHGRSISPRGYPWPQFNKLFPSSALPTIMPASHDNKIAVVNIGEAVITKLFGSVEALQSILHDIDSLKTPHSFVLKAHCEIESNVDIQKVELRNIVGLLPGSDPKLKDEIVVIGGHYDHVGNKTVPEGQDGIYNGADDNASGTTGVMEVAKAFSLCETPPRRSLLFIAFAAEEKGLLGSRAYVANPLFPIRNHVAMINMDMIGRNYPDSLSIGGESRCPELKKINEEENHKIGFTLAYNIEQYFFRSDQASFAQEKIPVIFYFAGVHSDYHKVSDEPDKIDYEKLARVARLCFLTSWRVANLDERLPFTEPKN